MTRSEIGAALARLGKGCKRTMTDKARAQRRKAGLSSARKRAKTRLDNISKPHYINVLPKSNE